MTQSTRPNWATETEAEALERQLSEARAEAQRFRSLLRDVVIPEFRELLDFTLIEVPGAVGTPPHIRSVLERIEAELQVPYVPAALPAPAEPTKEDQP